MEWEAPKKPAELTESRLVAAILEGDFPIDSHLPAERQLARQLGVTRPTLREALQRLARDGWVEIQHGKPTRVCNYWREGNLAVLAAIAQRPEHQPSDFIPNLLYFRQIVAPAYAHLAVEYAAQQIAKLLEGYQNLPDDPAVFAQVDWDLHQKLTIASGNPVFTLILNGFRDLYPLLGRRYFTLPQARDYSRTFYQDLLASARQGNADQAEAVTRRVMVASLNFWHMATSRKEPQ